MTAGRGKLGNLIGAAMGGGSGDAGAAGYGSGKDGSDHLKILSGTLQNVVGLGVFVLASFGMNVLIARAFGDQGADALGVVTLATQIAFVTGAATRFGMDMASTRLVAIEFGKGDLSRARSTVHLAWMIAAAVSGVVAIIAAAAAPALGNTFHMPTAVFYGVALAIPFVALTQVFAAASRGMKIMSHTLYAYWIGQSISWIVFSLAIWQVTKSDAATVFAYAGSWMFGTLVGGFLWRRETSKVKEQKPAEPGEAGRLIRFGAPRAPAALLSQALFWVDFFVLALFANQAELGVYAASVRLAQTLVLFLTAVSYMFSPYVADLHERGERQKLDGLFKSITRWTLALTLPLLGLLLVVPGPALSLFGAEFTGGTTPLRILLIGQIVNVSVGAAGFILIMVKRTGWDLIVYASSFLIDIVVSFALIPSMGSTGAAIAQTTTIAFMNAFRIYLVYRFVGIHPYNKYYFRLVIPFTVMMFVMIGTHLLTDTMAWPVDLLLTGIVGTIVYGIVLLLTATTPTEKAALKRLRGAISS